MSAHDAGVGEEDVEAAVGRNGFVDDRFHGGFVRRVESAGMDVDGWVEGIEFFAVRIEELGVEVADVDCEGAVAGELVGAGAADAEGRVGAGDDDDFTLDSSGVISVPVDLAKVAGEGCTGRSSLGRSGGFGVAFRGWCLGWTRGRKFGNRGLRDGVWRSRSWWWMEKCLRSTEVCRESMVTIGV